MKSWCWWYGIAWQVQSASSVLMVIYFTWEKFSARHLYNTAVRYWIISYSCDIHTAASTTMFSFSFQVSPCTSKIRRSVSTSIESVLNTCLSVDISSSSVCLKICQDKRIPDKPIVTRVENGSDGSVPSHKSYTWQVVHVDNGFLISVYRKKALRKYTSGVCSLIKRLKNERILYSYFIR